MHAIPKLKKITLSATSGNINDLISQDHHVITKHQFFCLKNKSIYFLFSMITLERLTTIILKSFAGEVILNGKIFT